MKAIERYQLVKDANEQIHAMITGRTVTEWDLSELKTFARVQAEIMTLQAKADLAKAKELFKNSENSAVLDDLPF